MSHIVIVFIFFHSLFSMMMFHKEEKFFRPVRSVRDFKIFTQRLDHFNLTNKATFNQRYAVNEDFYSNSHILIVYISGESKLTTSRVEVGSGGFAVYLAQKYGALIAALEHRYYGQSIPGFPECGDNCLDIDHLQYLSSEQGLDDLATFIDYLKTDLWKDKDIRKVIIIGGSYAGAMAAWMRSLYPHLVDAALASSGPVNATEEFFQYDQSVASGLNDTECAANIRKAVAESDQSITDNFTKIRDQLKCALMESEADADDLRYALADAVAYAVQYNQETGTETRQMRKNLCNIMKKDDGSSFEDRYYEFFMGLLQNLSTNCSDFADSREQLSQTAGDENSSGRQWYWQSCREFGYFQTAPAVDPLRSPRINLEYHHNLCTAIFNETYRQPDIDATNSLYGGTTPRGTNIDFTNGELDPWHMLGVYPGSVTTASTASASGTGARSRTRGGGGRVGARVLGDVLDDTDGHVERQNWKVYLIRDGSHCNDLRQPGSASVNADIQKVQSLLEQDVRGWLGYLDPTNDSFSDGNVVTKKTVRDEVLAFISPFLIAAMAVFVVGVIALIICGCVAYRLHKRAKSIEAEKQCDSSGQRLISKNED